MFGIFGRKRKPGVTYWVDINKIKLTLEELNAEIDTDRYEREKGYYLQTGHFWSNIYLRSDNTLTSGYYTYLICRSFDLGKVPVLYDEV